jgi:hypothetical protein
VVTSGYVGNWEILGQAIAAAGGYPIASPFYDPRVTALAQPAWLANYLARR